MTLQGEWVNNSLKDHLSLGDKFKNNSLFKNTNVSNDNRFNSSSISGNKDQGL